jgi:hypothetical protein
MPVNYVLIDYENIHPRNLELLADHPFRVFVFVGQNQARIPFDLADSMQLLGNHARYIKVDGGGQNALNFYIAYYVGELAALESEANFYVVSRDKGFDPLIRHLHEKKMRVRRVTDLGKIPLLQLSAKSSMDEKISAIVKNLGGRGQSRPRKVTTLQKAINSLFTRELDQKELNELVNEMKRRKLIVVNQTNVSYKLPH